MSIAFSSPLLQANPVVAETKKVQFADVIIYYFEREQGSSSVPDRGGCSLSMSQEHFAVSSYPVKIYSKITRLDKKITNSTPGISLLSPIHHAQSPMVKNILPENNHTQKSPSPPCLSPNSSMTKSFTQFSEFQTLPRLSPAKNLYDHANLLGDDSMDNSLSMSSATGRLRNGHSHEKLQPLDYNARVKLLKKSGVEILNDLERVELEDIRKSRARVGCRCGPGFCAPTKCPCALAGIPCQMDREAFPCSCTRHRCMNHHGRVEFSERRVLNHSNHVLSKIKCTSLSVDEEECAHDEDLFHCFASSEKGACVECIKIEADLNGFDEHGRKYSKRTHLVKYPDQLSDAESSDQETVECNLEEDGLEIDDDRSTIPASVRSVSPSQSTSTSSCPSMVPNGVSIEQQQQTLYNGIPQGASKRKMGNLPATSANSFVRIVRPSELQLKQQTPSKVITMVNNRPPPLLQLVPTSPTTNQKTPTKCISTMIPKIITLIRPSATSHTLHVKQIKMPSPPKAAPVATIPVVCEEPTPDEDVKIPVPSVLVNGGRSSCAASLYLTGSPSVISLASLHRLSLRKRRIVRSPASSPSRQRSRHDSACSLPDSLTDLPLIVKTERMSGRKSRSVNSSPLVSPGKSRGARFVFQPDSSSSLLLSHDFPNTVVSSSSSLITSSCPVSPVKDDLNCTVTN